MSTLPPYKRIIAPAQQPKVEVIQASHKPELARLLEDTLQTMQTEILRLKRRSNDNMAGLSPTDANLLQGYAKTLVQMAKEVREAEAKKAAEMENLSPEELLAALKEEVARVEAEIAAKQGAK